VEGRGGPRIAFVGGGSYQWGPKIIQDFALNEELRGGSLILHDINGEALEDMYEWGIRALDVAQADLKLEKTQRLEGALSGADFVVLSISTGGLDATALDLEIPARYGVVQTVGDTVGPGGLFRGLRNIPVVVEIARTMERSCPNAVLLNLTNPLTVLTRAVTKATSITTVGLCHELFSTLGILSKLYLRHVLAEEPFPYDLLESAKGVQLAELGLRSWRERRWLEVPELEPSRTPEKEYGRA
jgi:alpha-galactosidase